MHSIRSVALFPIRGALACAASALVALGLAGCTSVYYSAWEQVGVEKRHILIDRVEDGREDQQAAQEQFVSALDAFKAATSYDGGDLEDLYDDLNAEYLASVERADAVRERIDSIERVAGDLFSEWEGEIEQISDSGLRSRSRSRLKKTRGSYGDLIGAMRRAEQRMAPVLTAFSDRVLYLKHNLNAHALASLEADAGEIESDVDRLVADMNASIAEAEAFLAELGG